MAIRTARRLALTACITALGTASAFAADWPTKPVTLVLPYPPGGNVDNAARVVGERLQARFGQPFIIENKPGAGGLIAGEYVARAAPDGYTFFVGANGPILFSPVIFGRPDAYAWNRDFVPVSMVSVTPLVLQVKQDSPLRSYADLMAAAAKPDNKLTMASPGAGTQNHLVSEFLQRKENVTWTTAHYRGNAPATTDVVGGQVQFNFDQLSVADALIKSGRTRALAVTSEERIKQLPDVPTLRELGVDDFSSETFTGILAPKGTPQAIVDELAGAVGQALEEPEVRRRFEDMGATARAMPPQEFAAFLQSEQDRWLPIIKNANITAQ